MEYSNSIQIPKSKNQTYLDKIYNNFIKKSLTNITEEIEDRWYIYQTIINELTEMGKEKIVNEVKYRITDGEDPNKVFLSIIDTDIDTKAYLWIHRATLKRFEDEDLINRFY